MRGDGTPIVKIGSALARFLRTESASAIVLMLATLVALALANSPLAAAYQALWHHSVEVRAGGLTIELSLAHVINDGLMAVFFLLVGLEIKRELVLGELAGLRKAALPVLAALGGMLVPAGLYALITRGTPFTGGWGIPMATDIAFTVGVLSLLGRRAPVWLMVFLTALAIADDLGAVLVIALFYAGQPSLGFLGAAAALLVLLAGLNHFGVRRLWPYVVAGALLWVAVLGSGVHATLAGVALGMSIPATAGEGGPSPLDRLERALQKWVAFGVLPLFALANSGVTIPWRHLGPALTHPITVGVFVGLLAGKTIGVFGATLASVKLKVADLPAGATLRQLLGGSSLAGIGFTMSIFIATLAFREPELLDYARIGIIAGSICSALAGVAILLRRAR